MHHLHPDRREQRGVEQPYTHLRHENSGDHVRRALRALLPKVSTEPKEVNAEAEGCNGVPNSKPDQIMRVWTKVTPEPV